MANTSEALVATDRAPRYLKQLCSHFARDRGPRRLRIEVRVRQEETSGVAEFGWLGSCAMHAEPDGLRLRVRAADPLRRRIVQRVIASHLERFGRRDRLAVHWGRPS